MLAVSFFPLLCPRLRGHFPSRPEQLFSRSVEKTFFFVVLREISVPTPHQAPSPFHKPRGFVTCSPPPPLFLSFFGYLPHERLPQRCCNSPPQRPTIPGDLKYCHFPFAEMIDLNSASWIFLPDQFQATLGSHFRSLSLMGDFPHPPGTSSPFLL